jgi:hypothetical protein
MTIMASRVLLIVKTAKIGDPMSTKFLLTKSNGNTFRIPGAFMPKLKTALETASDMLKQMLGFEALVAGEGWLPLTQVGTYTDVKRFAPYCTDRIVSVLYSGIVPEEVPPNNSNYGWVSIKSIIDGQAVFGDHLDLIRESLTRG